MSSFKERLSNIDALHEWKWIVDWARRQFDDRRPHAVSQSLDSIIDAIVLRREAGEPLAYVFGEWSFRAHEFALGPGVLIPRPETEELVELFFKGHFEGLEKKCDEDFKKFLDTKTSFVVADLGAGTGCIGLSIALEWQSAHEQFQKKTKKTQSELKSAITTAPLLTPKLKVYLVESSPEALRWLDENLERHKSALVNVKVVVCREDWNQFRPEEVVDCFISNPPYISESEYLSLDSSVRSFEPRSALVPPSPSSASGLEAYENLLGLLPNWIGASAKVLFELGTGQASAIKDVCQEKYRGIFINVQIEKDLAAKERFFLADLQQGITKE